MPTDIQELLQRYRDAFNALDGAAVARLYAIPSGIAQDRQYTHWSSFEPIRSNMEALCEPYRRRGYAQADFQPGACLPQGDEHALVDLQRKIEWSTGAELWQFGTTYNLVCTEDGWAEPPLSSPPKRSKLEDRGDQPGAKRCATPGAFMPATIASSTRIACTPSSIVGRSVGLPLSASKKAPNRAL